MLDAIRSAGIGEPVHVSAIFGCQTQEDNHRLKANHRGGPRPEAAAAEIWTAGLSGSSAQQQHDAASAKKTMAKRLRRNQGLGFKAKAPVAAIKAETAMIKLAQAFEVHQASSSRGVTRCLAARRGHRSEDPACEERRATLEHDALLAYAAPLGTRSLPRCPARSAGRVSCLAQENDRSHRQAERQSPGQRAGDQPGEHLLQAPPGVGRRSEADATLSDKLHMEFPVTGSRMLQGPLHQEGFRVGRLQVATLMKRMGIKAL